MRIGEVAEQTGLSISNIRFYEKKGLIEPERAVESKYRDYTDQDVEQLKKIILLRKLDLPIETISAIINENASVQEAIKKQEEALIKQQEMIQGSINLCQKLLKEENLERLDVDYYLNYVKEEEQKGVKFAEIEELLEDFAEFTQVTKLLGDPYIGSLFLNKWVRRGLSVLWCLWVAVMPILVAFDSMKDHGEIRLGAVIFGMIWWGAGIGSFMIFRKK